MSALLKVVVVLMVAAVVALPLPAVHGELKIGFYDKTCPAAETLVRQAVASAFASDSGVAPGLIRMHFHDCFVRGCDASVLLDGPNTERTAVPNQSLRGFEVIDSAKAAIEARCPSTVSCADILAFAARDSADLAGNITWKVPAGRRDGTVSVATEVGPNLPPPSFNAQQLVESFKNKSLTAEEMVTLSGAHSIGRAHCFTFTRRLYNGTTPQTDPNLSFAYAELLRNLCPSNSGPSDTITTLMDIITPTTLDNKYYVGVLNNLGLFVSDHALLTDAELRDWVEKNAEHPNGWATRFKRAMVKMGNIEVLEGKNGEIRTKCSVVNTKSSKNNNIFHRFVDAGIKEKMRFAITW